MTERTSRVLGCIPDVEFDDEPVLGRTGPRGFLARFIPAGS
jgi:hypothetical protein